MATELHYGQNRFYIQAAHMHSWRPVRKSDILVARLFPIVLQYLRQAYEPHVIGSATSRFSRVSFTHLLCVIGAALM